jgi:hypothetical protein
MAQILCRECGAENDSAKRFCLRCDAYLDWDEDTRVETPEDQHDVPVTELDDSPPAPPQRSDGAARPPQITTSTTTATLAVDTGAHIDIEVRNRSTIVDAFRIDMIAPPRWLTLAPGEVRVLPNESGLLPAAFGIQPGTRVVVQTVDVVVRVSSVRDTDQYVDAKISLTVSPVGPPVSIKLQPSVVRLVDQTEGRVQIRLDNTESNHPRTITLTGSDDQAALEFLFSPSRLEVGPGRVGETEVHISAPEISEGTTETRTAVITATDGENTTEASLTVNQQRSALQPLQLRLEPGVVRIGGRHDTQVQLVIDNRNGRQDRHVDLEGRDPEGAMRFWFEQPSVVVPAGSAVAVRVRISAPKPTVDQVRRPFSVAAVESSRYAETTGTLEQIKASNWVKPVLIVGAMAVAAGAALGAGWLLFGSAGDEPQPQATSPNVRNEPVVTTTSTTVPAAPPEPRHLDEGTPLPSDPPQPLFGLPGTDAQGFIDYPGARCDKDSSPAAMARTTKSVLVVCRAGPGDFYYRGLRLSDSAGIELGDAVRSSGGFDVTNPTDGTRYQIRPERLTIITPSGKALTEQMVDYASI